MSLNVLLLYMIIEMMQQFEKRKKTNFAMSRVCSNQNAICCCNNNSSSSNIGSSLSSPPPSITLNLKKKLNPTNQLTKTSINLENQMTKTIINLKS